jgi:anti-sigma B factor antagonist
LLDQTSSGIALLRLEGEHDLSTADEVAELLRRAQEGRAAVVIDVSEASFIDSAIIAAMVAAHRRAREERLGLAICTGAPEEGDASAAVQRVLGVTGLEEQLQVHSKREEAVSAARRGAA